MSNLVREIRSKVTPPISAESVHRCWFTTWKVNGRGHTQFKYKNVKYLAHRVMAFAQGEPPYTYQPYDATTKIDASHLCGDRKCVNPNHLVLENTLINQTRDCCRMFKDKQGYFCPHTPPCIGLTPVATVQQQAAVAPGNAQ